MNSNKNNNNLKPNIMKTVIYLQGKQATGKTTFLNKHKIKEYFVDDFNKASDFLYKPSLLVITSNTDSDYEKIKSLALSVGISMYKSIVPDSNTENFYSNLTKKINDIKTKNSTK